MERNSISLRSLEAETWSSSELEVETNAEVFHDLITVHHDLTTRAHGERKRRPGKLDRALNLLSAKCVHLLRTAWIGTMCGYQGAHHPLTRAVHETALTMLYLRRFPGDLSIWMKESKTSDEERRLWPSAMMSSLGLPERETQLHKLLAGQAHATAASVAPLASYDPESDSLEIAVGAQMDRSRLMLASDNLCLFAALSALTIARTVKHALADGVPSEEAIAEFSNRIQEMLDRREEPIVKVEGTTVFDMFKGRRRPS